MINPVSLFFVLAMGIVLMATPADTSAQTPDSTVEKRSGVAQAEGVRIHYDVYGDLGSGTVPLLVLHGAYMSADAMSPFVERFARTRPVIVPDQRSHGRTGDAPGPITYERMADDAAAVMDVAGVQRVDVFGYSMGGSAAIQLAARHPDRVLRLVVVSACTRLDAAYPEVLSGIAEITPAVFDNTPIRAEYDRLRGAFLDSRDATRAPTTHPEKMGPSIQATRTWVVYPKRTSPKSGCYAGDCVGL